MQTITIVVKVQALEFKGNKRMAINYVRAAVRGWQGQYMPDDSRVENYDWEKAVATGTRALTPTRNPRGVTTTKAGYSPEGRARFVDVDGVRVGRIFQSPRNKLWSFETSIKGLAPKRLFTGVKYRSEILGKIHGLFRRGA